MTSKAEHTRNLQRAGLPTLETLTRRILAVFARATVADVEAGATWYTEAQDLATELGQVSGLGRLNAAAVISHLSPRTTWTRNVLGARELLANGGRADGIIGANFERASRVLTDGYDDPADSFGGPKTRRFYLNIIGDTEAVTVDVWAARVAGVEESLLGRKGVYDAVERAYQDAARSLGLEPSTVQATTWIVARGGRAK